MYAIPIRLNDWNDILDSLVIDDNRPLDCIVTPFDFDTIALSYLHNYIMTHLMVYLNHGDIT